MFTILKDLSFIKKVIIISMPIMFQQLITSFAQLIDNLMVGSLGAEAIAGVGSANMIYFVIMFMGFGISEGVGIYIAQMFGAKKNQDMAHVYIIGIYFAILLSSLSMLLVYTNGSNLLELFIKTDTQAGIDSLRYGLNYLNIIAIGYPIMLFNIVIGSCFRSIGRVNMPMYAGVTGIIINTSLNYILIYGNLGFEPMGVSGAALATLIARMIEFILLILFMYTIKVDFRPSINQFFTVPKKLMIMVARKVAPLTANEFMWGFGQASVMALYGSRGVDILTSVQITSTLSNMLFVVMSGFSVAVSILIGHRLGENKLELARIDAKKLTLLGFNTGFIMLLIAIILSSCLPFLYQTVDDSILVLSQKFLIVIGCFFPLYMVTGTCFFTLRAGGDTKGVFLMDGLFMWAVTIPLCFILVTYTNLPILLIYILVNSMEFCKTFLGLRRINKGLWLKNIV